MRAAIAAVASLVFCPEGTQSLNYDDADRISGNTNTASGASNWTYGYDALDSTTSAASSSITDGWTYDADGNRLSRTGTAASTYSIASGSRRVRSGRERLRIGVLVLRSFLSFRSRFCAPRTAPQLRLRFRYQVLVKTYYFCGQELRRSRGPTESCILHNIYYA